MPGTCRSRRQDRELEAEAIMLVVIQPASMSHVLVQPGDWTLSSIGVVVRPPGLSRPEKPEGIAKYGDTDTSLYEGVASCCDPEA